MARARRSTPIVAQRLPMPASKSATSQKTPSKTLSANEANHSAHAHESATPPNLLEKRMEVSPVNSSSDEAPAEAKAPQPPPTIDGSAEEDVIAVVRRVQSLEDTLVHSSAAAVRYVNSSRGLL